MSILPFYGGHHPELFAIERAAMDRPGHVLSALARLLPRSGLHLDIGAGDGFTARALGQTGRRITALEPDPDMIDREANLAWVRGEAEHLPFPATTFQGVYATWAFFFPSVHEITRAVREAERVLSPGGILAIANNLGNDEFCALSPRDITEPVAPFAALGFSLSVIDTYFEFESIEQAQTLLGFYFGEGARERAALRLQYRVGLFHKRKRA